MYLCSQMLIKYLRELSTKDYILFLTNTIVYMNFNLVFKLIILPTMLCLASLKRYEKHWILRVENLHVEAFDTVDHSILLKKLEHYGIGLADQWFRSYLLGRTQLNSVNGYDSEIRDMKYGVPQGSVLGPLLFLVTCIMLSNLVQFTILQTVLIFWYQIHASKKFKIKLTWTWSIYVNGWKSTKYC